MSNLSHSAARLGAVLLAAALMATLDGCAHHGSAKAGTVADAVPPGEFSWANQVIESDGSSGSSGTASGAQAKLANKQAAKTDAMAALKVRVRALPVAGGETVGSLMTQNMGLKRSIEKQLQSAQVVSEGQAPDGGYSVHVRLALAPIAEILKQNFITPDNLPPATPAKDNNGVPPLT
jgi:hypothetical protein